MSNQELYDLSLQAREMAYCPYSHFATGAALLGESGKVYLGCKENGALKPLRCAERRRGRCRTSSAPPAASAARF